MVKHWIHKGISCTTARCKYRVRQKYVYTL
jgi:hypothetical protein